MGWAGFLRPGASPSGDAADTAERRRWSGWKAFLLPSPPAPRGSGLCERHWTAAQVLISTLTQPLTSSVTL